MFIPESPPKMDWPERLCKQLQQARSGSWDFTKILHSCISIYSESFIRLNTIYMCCFFVFLFYEMYPFVNLNHQLSTLSSIQCFYFQSFHVLLVLLSGPLLLSDILPLWPVWPARPISYSFPKIRLQLTGKTNCVANSCR